ncbi:V-type ATP synthase subunit A [Thermithiobacillus plumbiphilus]|uniref:V-type ATP synthase alpha chain n=1 Tax=Thermithiobacillus plumbiphilus TaxID=1729899 RepID=A0ABU9D6D8_9PROT
MASQNGSERQNATALIEWISGPVLRARSEDPFQINEAVLVGDRRLLGEVIRIQGAEIVVQIYESTSGLRPGVLVQGTGLPLSIRLGPGLLGGIFDGLLRPLFGAQSHYVQAGMYTQPGKTFHFKPLVQNGQQLDPGSRVGELRAAEGKPQYCLLPPDLQGRVLQILPEGDYSDTQAIGTLEATDGGQHDIAMSHLWPVRLPRPITERLPADSPLITGQRVLDSLFPIARGGRAVLPGGFGTGKTVLQETLAKWAAADIIVYVGCGERGNEMTGILHEFAALQDPKTNRPLLERTVIIANTSNMPVAAREASIYTGVTVAEYYRDQGLHVALMADSTTRWAEALREISGRLGELPGEGGYPPYLSSRLAEFYERAAHVRCLDGSLGSLTIIGAVSPPGADLSEPVSMHTKRYVRSFWALDRGRAHARFYPAIDPLQSYSEDIPVLESWWRDNGNPQWASDRRRFLTLLEQQAHLERMARIIGKDVLPPRQQVTLLAASLINEGFLRQSAYSPVDRFASPARQGTMMRIIVRLAELAEQAVDAGASADEIGGLPVFRKLERMAEEIPEGSEDQFRQLSAEMESAFATLLEKGDHAR